MAIKPVVAYIEEGRIFIVDHNPARDALVYVLKEDFGCSVFLYETSYSFLEDFEKIKALKENGLLVLLIIKQEEYGKDHEEIIQQVRQDVSASLPIVVIPELSPQEEFTGIPGDNQLFILDHTDVELRNLVKGLVAYFESPQTAVEIECPNKILPEFIQFSPSLYDQESAKIRDMSNNERGDLIWSLRHFGGSTGSLNDNVWGFAIDPVTLEYAASNEFGCHDVVDYWLEQTLEHIEAIRRGIYSILLLPEKVRRRCRGRIMKGYIFPEVEGFVLPIFRLSTTRYEEKKGHIRRVASFFKTHRKMLPITVDGQLFEG